MTLRLNGSTSGYVELDCPDIGGNNNIKLPASNGSANNLLKNSGTAGELEFASNVNIDSSGRLLVGTSISPSTGEGQYSQLVVQGYVGANQDMGTMSIQRGTDAYNVDSGIGRIQFTNNSGNAYATIASFIDGTTGSGDYPGRLVFSTTADGASSPTERYRIDKYGNHYFNTSGSAPSASVFGAQVRGDGGVWAYRNVNGTFASNQFGGTAGYAQILGDGDLENTNNRYTGLSDLKFKQNIEDASSQWEDIKAIQVRKYELIASPDRKHIGCVAQELEQVCPGLVIERENLEGESYKSVAYSVLYMKAVKALQEAMERIEILEQRLADAGIT